MLLQFRLQRKQQSTVSGYEQKRDLLVSQFRQSAGQVQLHKDTSNLFRDRAGTKRSLLDVRAFDAVVDIDAGENHVVVEGMTPYEKLVDATLTQQRLPCVVPQLKSITIGGAISGVGIESASFKYGLVHETVLEMDVLTGSGEVVVCTPDNDHSDLFFGLPNSYGTLGYVLKLKARTIPVKPFVRLQHTRDTDLDAYFDRVQTLCGENIDFLDGVLFGPGEYYTTAGTFTDDAPGTSDYTFDRIYYRSVREKASDYLTTRDYIWRWDTDWFWCSKNVGAQNPVLRRLFGRKRLNSVFYAKLMRWNSKWGFTRFYDRLTANHAEAVIQDVDIPIDRAREFYQFFDEEIGIRPVWMCPISGRDGARAYPLYPMKREGIYVNFGFWDVVRGRQAKPEGFFNRMVEEKVNELGGIKSLYSDVFFPEQQFWDIYNQDAYLTLKKKYDPDSRFKDLYDKCVLRG